MKSPGSTLEWIALHYFPTLEFIDQKNATSTFIEYLKRICSGQAFLEH